MVEGTVVFWYDRITQMGLSEKVMYLTQSKISHTIFNFFTTIFV